MIVTIKMLWMCMSVSWRSNCREKPVRSDKERIMSYKRENNMCTKMYFIMFLFQFLMYMYMTCLCVYVCVYVCVLVIVLYMHMYMYV